MLDPFELTKVTAVYARSGFCTVQVESLSGGNLDFMPLHHPLGFKARPRDPDTNENGCGVLIAYEGERLHAWAHEDARFLSLLPDEGAGGSLQYAIRKDGSAFRASTLRLIGDGADKGAPGSLEIKVPYASGAKSHLIEIDLDKGEIRVTHGDGPAILMTASSVKISAPGDIDIEAQGQVNAGGSGGYPAVYESGALAASFADLASKLLNVGVTWSPPTGFAATKTRVK